MILSKRPSARKAGNIHRDAGRWKEAASEYRKHLGNHPEDAAIWVQYGHAVKESGDLETAEEAYKNATLILPGDADAWIHLGHLQKRLGKSLPAAAAFAEASALSIDETIQSDLQCLIRTLDPQDGAELKQGTILFAIQDLLIFLKYHVTMSGIQRVQCGIAQHVIEMPDVESRFIITDHTGTLAGGTFWEIDKAKLVEIIEYASGDKVDHKQLKTLIDRCEEDATIVTPGHGHIVILLGCFWAHETTVDWFIPAKQNGVRLGSYIYDIIPISHPEFCEVGLTKVFGQGLSEMCMVADFFLTISDYTRITLENFLRSHGSRVVPMMTVPLAHSLTGSNQRVGAWPRALQKVRGAEYVAYVSTIEGRKNHLYVVNIWRELIAQGKKVPDLVFVGRRGWRANGLIDFLEGTNYLDGRVHLVHDLSDGELNAIYGNSLFTVFTSLVEGWGLPVGESLLHKRLCVASSTTSVPEVGGDFVEYVDPTDIRDGVAKIGRLIEDRAYLAQRQKTIEDHFEPRGWDEVARTLVDRTREMVQLPQEEMPTAYLPEGELFRPSDLSRLPLRTDGYNPRARRLILSSAFYSAEPGGAWMKGKVGEISFQTSLSEGDAITVYVELYEANWKRSGSFVAFIADPSRSTSQTPIPFTLGNSNHRLQLRGLVGPKGVCRVLFEVTGDYIRDEAEGRDMVLGLRAVGYASPDNFAARTELYEAFMFVPAAQAGRSGEAIVDPSRVSTSVKRLEALGDERDI